MARPSRPAEWPHLVMETIRVYLSVRVMVLVGPVWLVAPTPEMGISNCSRRTWTSGHRRMTAFFFFFSFVKDIFVRVIFIRDIFVRCIL